jgi:hypothetical protein
LLSGYNIAIPAIRMTVVGRLTQAQAWTVIAVRMSEVMINAAAAKAGAGLGVAVAAPTTIAGQVVAAGVGAVVVGTTVAAATRAAGDALLHSQGIPTE